MRWYARQASMSFRDETLKGTRPHLLPPSHAFNQDSRSLFLHCSPSLFFNLLHISTVPRSKTLPTPHHLPASLQMQSQKEEFKNFHTLMHSPLERPPEKRTNDEHLQHSSKNFLSSSAGTDPCPVHSNTLYCIAAL